MIRIRCMTPALAAAALGVLAIAPGAVAAPPSPQVLNPAPSDIYTCKPIGGGTLCTGSVHEVKVSEEQGELVCGTGTGNDADLFLIHDNGFVDQRLTRTYNSDGNLTSRVIHEKWGDTFWSNPLSGKTVPYTQTNKITTILTVPGDFGSAVETTVGSNIYTDPATHEKVLTSAGRVVFGADGALESRAGQQPFIDAFVDGDMSVFDPICAALS